ncbi:MAG: hypothetical protein R3290_03635 [Acidimicrobiia bacterium]|nr:hypothetical protein [Acidimicrobiia bacterium]
MRGSDTIRISDRNETGGPRPPSQGLLAGAALVLAVLVVVGTVASGAPEDAPRPTIVDATEDDFDEFLATPTTTTTTIPATTTTIDHARGVAQRRDLQTRTAVDFLLAIGDGRGDDAAALVDTVTAAPVADLARFYAEFRSGLRASRCEVLAGNAVSCDVLTTDPALETIGAGSSRQRVIVSFAGDGGIQSFAVPSALASSSARLAGYARETDPESYAAACDPAAYASHALLPGSVGFAATPACGEILVGVARAYLADR